MKTASSTRFTIRNLAKVSPMLMLAFALGACAPDRDLDDHNRDKAAQDLGKAQAAAGVYVGELKMQKNSQLLGTMGLELGATSVPDGFNSTKPVLTGQFVFQAANAITINFTTGTYNPDDGTFQLTYTVAYPSSTQTVTLSMSGQVKDDTLNGKLEILGETGYGASFALSKKPSVKDVQGYLTQEGTTGEPIESFESNYNGSAVDRAANITAKATMSLSNTGSTLNDSIRFANVFQRKKIVRAAVTIVYVDPETGKDDASKTNIFNSAEWDLSTGVLEAVFTNEVNAVTQHLHCSPKVPGQAEGALGCTLELSKISSTTIELTLEPVKGLR